MNYMANPVRARSDIRIAFRPPETLYQAKKFMKKFMNIK